MALVQRPRPADRHLAALTGAYVLASCLSRCDSHAEAFAAYEDALRDHVRKSQRLPPGGPRLLHPGSRNGIRVLNGVSHALAALRARKLLAVGQKAVARAEFQLPG